MLEITNRDPKSAANRFHFRVPRRWFRSHYSLPFLQYVPLDVMKQARSSDKPMQLQEIAELIGEPRTAKAIGRLNQLEIAELEIGWLEESGVDLGELRASSR